MHAVRIASAELPKRHRLRRTPVSATTLLRPLLLHFQPSNRLLQPLDLGTKGHYTLLPFPPCVTDFIFVLPTALLHDDNGTPSVLLQQIVQIGRMLIQQRGSRATHPRQDVGPPSRHFSTGRSRFGSDAVCRVSERRPRGRATVGGASHRGCRSSRGGLAVEGGDVFSVGWIAHGPLSLLMMDVE